MKYGNTYYHQISYLLYTVKAVPSIGIADETGLVHRAAPRPESQPEKEAKSLRQNIPVKQNKLAGRIFRPQEARTVNPCQEQSVFSKTQKFN
jgi:hypothetical protein